MENQEYVLEEGQKPRSWNYFWRSRGRRI